MRHSSRLWNAFYGSKNSNERWSSLWLSWSCGSPIKLGSTSPIRTGPFRKSSSCFGLSVDRTGDNYDGTNIANGLKSDKSEKSVDFAFKVPFCNVRSRLSQRCNPVIIRVRGPVFRGESLRSLNRLRGLSCCQCLSLRHGGNKISTIPSPNTVSTDRPQHLHLVGTNWIARPHNRYQTSSSMKQDIGRAFWINADDAKSHSSVYQFSKHTDAKKKFNISGRPNKSRAERGANHWILDIYDGECGVK